MDSEVQLLKIFKYIFELYYITLMLNLLESLEKSYLTLERSVDQVPGNLAPVSLVSSHFIHFCS